jgi:hypothetical protein
MDALIIFLIGLFALALVGFVALIIVTLRLILSQWLDVDEGEAFGGDE